MPFLRRANLECRVPDLENSQNEHVSHEVVKGEVEELVKKKDDRKREEEDVKKHDAIAETPDVFFLDEPRLIPVDLLLLFS